MGLVYKLRLAEEALPALVNAMQRESKLEIRSEIDAPGFYLESGKIVGYRIEHPKPSPSELKTCAGVLDELISRSTSTHLRNSSQMGSGVAVWLHSEATGR